MKSLPRNQLRRYNVPPNHRPTCSSISQQHCHPRVGHDSSKDKGQCRLTHSQGTQSANQHHWVYQAFNNRPRQHSLKTNHCIHAAKTIPSQLCEEGKDNRQVTVPTNGWNIAQATRQLRVVLGPSVAKTTQLQHPKPRYFNNPHSQCKRWQQSTSHSG